MSDRKRSTPGPKELEAIGQTADRPWGVLEQPQGRGDRGAAFAPFRDALSGGSRERLRWVLDSLVYADLMSLSPPARVGLFRILEELVPGVTRGRWHVERPAPQVIKRVGRRSPRSERLALHPTLQAVIERSPRLEAFLTRPNDPIKVLTEAKARTRECIEMAAAGGIFMIGHDLKTEDHPGSGTLSPSRIRAFAMPVTIALHVTGDPARRELFEYITATLPDALVVAVLALFVQVPAEALGRCPYPEGAPSRVKQRSASPCGHVFVKRGPQRWCREHQKVVRREQLKDAFDKYQKKHRRKKGALRQKRGAPR